MNSQGGPPLPPSGELINVPEFEAAARAVLPTGVFATLAGGNRAPFERMTFRQKLMVDGTGIDLSTELFGERMFAPTIIGPVSAQNAYHAQGELETARGAAAAKTIMVVSSRSSRSVEAIAAETDAALWFQVYSDEGLAARSAIHRAVGAGVKAVCITVNDPSASDRRAFGPPRVDWDAVNRIADGAGVPVIVKGVLAPEDAERATRHGMQGIVVSDHGAGAPGRVAGAPIDVLPDIAAAAGDRLAVLIDGGFRRGTDILKALALGARAVLLARPIMWGLAAYGAAGVAAVLFLLHNELARSMVAAGRPAVALIDRALVRIHTR
ncbi:MAG: alpha-hydroxy-acid oxidizing protein [Acidobacteria bacterium]|nr:alpha-hydroxy-acid oxidizing protein [Acidobacteriota bacterium]